MHATNPALAQNINDLLTIFGGGRPQATRQAAQAEWRRLPPAETRLHRPAAAAQRFQRRGVSPQGREALGWTIDRTSI